MNAKTKTRIKTEAAAVAFQTREEVNAAIEQIGIAQRERDLITVAMNDELARVRARHEKGIGISQGEDFIICFFVINLEEVAQ